VDTNRRQFLKIMLIGSGVLVIGKILGPLFSRSSDVILSENSAVPEEEPPAFKALEDKRFLSIYDSSGEEVLQIDKLS